MIEPVNVPIILDLELEYEELDLSIEEAEEYGAQLASLITINEVYGGLPSGGVAGNILVKNSEEDYDASWYAPASIVEDGNGLPVTSDAVYDAVSVKYTKPSDGIPKSDLEAAVQSSLDKADTALQEHQDISGKLNITGGVMLGNINMHQNWVKNIHAATAPYDAVNLKQVQTIVTDNAATYRGSFQTKQALITAPWQNSDPEEEYYVDANDFAIVQADESNNNECWRYAYARRTGWTEQYKINDAPMSSAQIDALNSGITTVKVQKLDTIEPSAEVNIIEEIRTKNPVTEQWTPLPVINKGVNLPDFQIPEEIYYTDFIVTKSGDDFIVTGSDLPPYIITQIEGGRIVIGRINYDGIFYALITEAVEQPLNVRFICQTNDGTFLNIQNEEEYGWTISFFTTASEEIVETAVSSLSEVINTKYSKPSDGIPASDLANDVPIVPSGGTTGQILKKFSNNDWDVNWADDSGADNNNVWTVDEQNTRVIGDYVQIPVAYLVGPSSASAKASDVVFISDGRFTQISRIVGQRADTTLIGDLHGTDGQDGHGVPVGGTIGQVLKKKSSTDYDTEWVDESGTFDYSDLTNKPQINSVDLTGNKSLSDLGIEPEAFVVTITQSGSTYSADKTYFDTAAAISAGKRVAAMLNGYEYQLFNYAPNSYTIIFSANQGTAAKTIAFSLGDAVAITENALGTYSKPSGGIPATDLTSDVQTSLGKADTALQSANEVVWMTYGTSTDAEIQAALDANKLPAVYYKGYIYVLHENTSNGYVFSRSYIGGSSRVSCKNNSWSSGALNYPSAATATPSDLGTAAVGSSTKYAKEDHVHNMPSAADVGAIAAPSSPNSGQYLQYDGDFWEAVTLPAIPSQPSDIGAYALPSGGIPKTDLAIAIQSSLDKADSALQSAPVTSVNGQTGAVNLSIPSIASDISAVAIAQGSAHAGEFLVVGNDGIVTTMTLATWQGGNY